jgi:hypothetical protein
MKVYAVWEPNTSNIIASAVKFIHELPGPRPQMAPAKFREPGRAGARRQGAAACARGAAPASCLSIHRNARRWQDHAGAHPRQVPQLRDGHCGRALRQVRRVHGDRRRAVSRPHRDRRGDEHRRGRDALAAGQRGLRPGARALQGVRDRRSAHALQVGVQFHAQDPGRAACAHQVHPGDDGPAEDSRDRAVALPAVQPEADAARGDRRAPGAHPRRRWRSSATRCR